MSRKLTLTKRESVTKNGKYQNTILGNQIDGTGNTALLSRTCNEKYFVKLLFLASISNFSLVNCKLMII